MKLSHNYRLILFGSVYFVQGVVLSYFITFNVIYLGNYGYGPIDMGIFLAVLTIPYVLKIFLGMISDSVNLLELGHRIPYIIIGLVGQAVVLLLLPHISVVDGLGMFVLVSFFGATFMALYDSCTDGLALDTTPDDQLSKVQGIMKGAQASGTLIMLLVSGLIVDTFGWLWLFYVMSMTFILPMLFILRVKEDPVHLKRREFRWSSFKALTKPVILMTVALGLIYAFALNGTIPFLSDYLGRVMKVSMSDVGLMVALSMIGRISGALICVPITKRIGYKRSLYVAIGLTSIASFGLALKVDVTVLAFFAFLLGVAFAYYGANYNAVAMSLSDPHILASMFAIFMMFVNLSGIFKQILGGILTEYLGFQQMVLVMGLINLTGIFLVMGIFRKRSAKSGVEMFSS